MAQTLNIINNENVFKCYDKIFTLKRFWDLMEKNNVEMTYAKELAIEIIGRSFSDQVFARIKNYGNFISNKGFVYAFSDETYNSFIGDESNKYLDSGTKKAITKVLLENANELTMLDYKFFLKGKFPNLEKNFEDLKSRMENEKENICIPAYYLAIYNTYITGLILENAVGKCIRKIMKDNEKIYYTSAKITKLLSKLKDSTALCDRNEFWEAAENYNDKHPVSTTAKEFNYVQMQRICWTAYRLGITEECKANELLYILLNIDSSFKKIGLSGLNVKEYIQLLENNLKSKFPMYVF